MDTKTIAHIGAEVLLIGGIILYYNKKLGELSAQNEGLLKRIEQMEKVIANHDRVLRLMLSDAQNTEAREQKPQCKNGKCPVPKPPPEEDFNEEELDNELTEEYEKLESERVSKKVEVIE